MPTAEAIRAVPPLHPEPAPDPPSVWVALGTQAAQSLLAGGRVGLRIATMVTVAAALAAPAFILAGAALGFLCWAVARGISSGWLG